MSAVFAAIGRFSVRFRWLVLAGWIAGAFAAVSMLPSLSSVAQANNQNFLPASAPSMRAARLAAPLGSADLQPITVVAARPAGRLTAADTAALAALQFRAIPGVSQVRDLGTSPDGRAEQIQVMTAANGNGTLTALSTQNTGLVGALRARISAARLPAGLQVHLAGNIATQVDSQNSSGSTSSAMLNVAAAVVVVMLFVVFRSLLAPLLTLAPAVLSVAIAGPLIAEATRAGLQVPQIAQLLMIVLVLGAGTDYGLFLVLRTREELRAGQAPKDAVVRAVTRVGESITFSAGTVIAALLSLLAASFALYSDLAAPLAIGIGVMLIAGLTLLPALLAITGRAAFWPATTKAGTGRTGLWVRITRRLARRPALTLAAGIAVFAALAVGAFGYKAGGFGGQANPPAGSDSAHGDAMLAQYFPAATANPTNLIFKLRAPAWQDHQAAGLAAATRQLNGSSLLRGMTGPLGSAAAPLSPAQLTALRARLGPASALPAVPPPGTSVSAGLYQAYRATASYISADGRTIQFASGLAAGNPGGTAAMNAVPAIRAEAARVAATLHAPRWGVTGQAPAAYDISSTSGSDLARVIPLAIVVIGVLLALVMRSLIAPWYLIASVGLSYLAALGVTVLIFMKIGGQAGLTFFLPFLMFVFLLALGEDYNILVMTRIREEARHRPIREAVTQALNATGTTVTSAGLVLAGTFAVFAIVGGPSMGSAARDVGYGLAVGILMDTFLVRTLLIPATVVLLGRWNWWPSRLGSATRTQEAGTAAAGTRAAPGGSGASAAGSDAAAGFRPAPR